MIVLRLSHSKMRSYLFCPRAYWFKYVEEIRMRASAPLVFGSAVHAAIRELHLGDEMTPEAGSALFARIWKESLATDEPLFKDGKQSEASYAKLGGEMLAQYAASHADCSPPLVVEYEFAIEHDFDGQRHLLNGFIDRIDEEPDRLVIWDYKTGRTKPSPKEVASDVQLTLYAWAAEQTLGREVVQCIYYHLRKGERLPTERNTMDYDRLLNGVIPNVVRGIEAEAFAGVYDFRCRMCEYREICQPDKFPTNTNGKE